MEKDNIIKLYNSGFSLRDVSQKTGESYKTVLKVCEESGILRKKEQLDKLTVELIQELYISQKKSIRNIATQLGYGDKTIAAFIKDNNICKRKAKDTSIISNEKLESIKELYEDGLNLRQISEKVDISQSRIRNFLIKEDLLNKSESISKEELKNLYLKQNLSLRDIANLKNCSIKKVQLHLKKYKIEKKEIKYEFNEQELIILYKKHNLSINEIAKIKNSSNYLVKNSLEDFNLLTKPIKKEPKTSSVEEVVQNSNTNQNNLNVNKIEYLNETYGINNWKILNKESFRKHYLKEVI